MEAGSLKVC